VAKNGSLAKFGDWLDIAAGNLVPGGCEKILKQSNQELFWRR